MFRRQRQPSGSDVLIDRVPKPLVDVAGRQARERVGLCIDMPLKRVVQGRLLSYLADGSSPPVHVVGNRGHVARLHPLGKVGVWRKPVAAGKQRLESLLRVARGLLEKLIGISVEIAGESQVQ